MSLETLLDQCPVCTECRSSQSAYWHHNDAGDVVCDTCFSGRQEVPSCRTTRGQAAALLMASSAGREEDEKRPVESNTTGSSARAGSVGLTRRSSRLKPSNKSKPWHSVVKLSAKGRGRRLAFKKNPAKAPVSVATTLTSDYVFYQGSYWQIGDIISVTDVDDGLTYYAQLRGFLEDQYCNKSAVITWLIPKPDHQTVGHAGKKDFNPDAYVAGPEEDLPRDMVHFEFVCHAPSDYFNISSLRQSSAFTKPLLGCFWTSVGPEIQPLELSTATSDSRCPDSDLKPVNAETDARLDKDAGRRSLSSVKEKTRSHKASWSRLKDKKS